MALEEPWDEAAKIRDNDQRMAIFEMLGACRTKGSVARESGIESDFPID